MESERHIVRGWPAALLSGAGVGALCGSGWAWLLARQSHHVELGFRREAWELLRDGAGLGLLIGLGLAGLLLVRARLAPTWPAALARLEIGTLTDEIRSRPRSILVAFALAQLAVVALALRQARAGPIAVVGVLGAWVLWSVDYALLRVARPPSSTLRAAGAAALDVALAIGVYLVLENHVSTAFRMLRAAPWTGLAVFAAIALFAGLFAVVWWRRALSRSEPRAVSWGLLGAALLPLLLPAGLWLGPPPTPAVRARHPWNVILIGVDTLRLDRTMLLNKATGEPADRDLTPNLRRLAGRGSVFRNAISQAPWTLPAFASIFTGKYPHSHGANGFRGILSRREVTLTELLREAGYQTHAVVSHFLVNSERGFSQGFQRFNEDYVRAYVDVTSHNVTDAGLRFLRERGPDPFFLFLHYFDPHYTYNDHADWHFADAYDGWLREQMHIANLRLKRHLLEPRDIAYLRDLYDEEIAFTDREIGRLVDFLEEKELLQSTVLVFVSDHGEEFFERGWLGHTITLHEELIRVPMLIVLPQFTHEAAVVDEVVETRAIFPTIVEHLGLEWEGAPTGSSLLAPMRGEPSREGARAFSSTWLPTSPLDSGKRVRLSCLRTPRWKLIVDHTRGRVFLYDLDTDPEERQNVAGQEPERLLALRDDLDRWLGEVSAHGLPGAQLELDAETRERLKALGYL